MKLVLEMVDVNTLDEDMLLLLMVVKVVVAIPPELMVELFGKLVKVAMMEVEAEEPIVVVMLHGILRI